MRTRRSSQLRREDTMDVPAPTLTALGCTQRATPSPRVMGGGCRRSRLLRTDLVELLAVTGDGVGEVDNVEDLGAAEAGDLHSSHGCRPSDLTAAPPRSSVSRRPATTRVRGAARSGLVQLRPGISAGPLTTTSPRSQYGPPRGPPRPRKPDRRATGRPAGPLTDGHPARAGDQSWKSVLTLSSSHSSASARAVPSTRR